MARKANSGLTDQQEAFVREYCVDRNGTQAAIRAGYSAKTANEQAARLLANVSVRSAVDAQLEKIAAKVEVDAEWVLRRLVEEAQDMENGGNAASRVRATELVGKIRGVFEADNKQKAGIFDGLPKTEIDAIVERLRAIRQPSVAGRTQPASPSRFTH